MWHISPWLVYRGEDFVAHTAYFFWLAMVLAAVCGIFCWHITRPWISVWNLVAWPELNPGPLHVGAWSLNHWTTGSPLYLIFNLLSLVTRRITSDARTLHILDVWTFLFSVLWTPQIILLQIFSQCVLCPSKQY